MAQIGDDPLTQCGSIILPPALVAKVASFPLLRTVEPDALHALLEVADWFSLPGGCELTREGDNDEALFLVVAGCLGVFVPNGDGGETLVAHVPQGETAGEMSVLSGEPHSAVIAALRDSELLRVPRRAFLDILARYPSLSNGLMRLLVDRLRRMTRKSVQTIRPRTFAFVPLHDGLDLDRLTIDVARALEEMGVAAAIVNPTAVGQPTEWFTQFEEAHEVILYEGEEPDSAWTQFCIRQADRVVLVARAGAPLPLHRALAGAHAERTAHELVVLHDGEVGEVPGELIAQARLHHHLRKDRRTDAARLARLLSGRATGLVLAGGGARGFAHIGVIRALREAGMPIDLVGGSSMGAIVAAGVALEWSDAELRERIRAAFVTSDPLSDYTLPLIALFRGRKVARLLRENFGAARIEDLPVRYFCVTSDLTAGVPKAHRSGPLWRALQASVAIPGLLPPVVFDGHLHVDGGIMNNLPIDVMAQMGRGPVVGVDVAGDENMSAPEGDYSESGLFELLRRLKSGTPGIVHILLRTGTVGNAFHRRAAQAQADLLIEPPLEGISLRDWHMFDRAVDEGYAFACRAIDRDGLPTGKSMFDKIRAA